MRAPNDVQPGWTQVARGIARLVVVPGTLVSLALEFRSPISRRGSRPHCRRKARRSRR